MDIVLSERKLSTLDLKPFELYLICKHAAGTKERYYEQKGEFAQPKLPYTFCLMFLRMLKSWWKSEARNSKSIQRVFEEFVLLRKDY